MRVDLFTSAGTKKGTLELPEALFGGKINAGLMHLAVVRQQANRRRPIAHVKTRGEVRGSTRKLFQQKGTGRARRGPIRSPLLRGGGRAFGPRNERNFRKDMPKSMRRSALLSALAHAARMGKIVALEKYEGDAKTKSVVTLLSKLPITSGRRVLVVLPCHEVSLERGARNVPRVKTLLAPYLNPEDLLGSHHIVFLVDAIKVAEDTFAKSTTKTKSTKSSKISSNSSQSSLSSSSS
jgi:large subunit ribosomal protein L4